MISWNNTEVTKAVTEISAASGVIRDSFASLINGYMASPKSIEYWDLISGEWLLHFTHVVYAAYRDVLATNGQQNINRVIPIFPDYRVFLQAVVNDDSFTRNLRAHIQEMLHPTSDLTWSFSTDSIFVGNRDLSYAENAKQKTLRSVTACFGSGRAPFVFCNPYLKCGYLKWFGTLGKWRRWARQDNYYYPVSVFTQVDQQWRRQRSKEISIEGFPELVMALLPLYVPVIFLEGYESYRKKTHSLELTRPKTLYTANSLQGHTLFKVLAADWREEGTRILNHQHGGGYGLERYHALEEYETMVSDRFYTLGWEGENPKQVALTAAAMQLRSTPVMHRHRVLLTCTTYPKNVYRVHFQPMPGTIERLFAETFAFLGLTKDLPELVVRPHQLDWGWKFVDSLKGAFPQLCLDDPRLRGPQSFQRSALVVHNYLGTSWLETLAMNIPTVCFYDAEIYAFREKALPYIDRLTAVGILHKSGADAAYFVKDIAKDPHGWWSNSEVQAVRREFVERYASYSPDWTEKWESEFKQWID